MIAIRVLSGVLTMLAAACALLSPSLGENAEPAPSFQAHVDMKTFMEHVLTPAAKIVWSVNAVMIDEKGEHDLSPKTEDDWERIVSGAATLAEATNALMIPQRARDPQWKRLRQEVRGRRKQGLSGGLKPAMKATPEASRSARRNLRRLPSALWPAGYMRARFGGGRRTRNAGGRTKALVHRRGLTQAVRPSTFGRLETRRGCRDGRGN